MKTIQQIKFSVTSSVKNEIMDEFNSSVINFSTSDLTPLDACLKQFYNQISVDYREYFVIHNILSIENGYELDVENIDPDVKQEDRRAIIKLVMTDLKEFKVGE